MSQAEGWQLGKSRNLSGQFVHRIAADGRAVVAVSVNGSEVPCKIALSREAEAELKGKLRDLSSSIPDAAVISESFDGPDGIFCSSDAFWVGVQDNPTWFAESGSFSRKGNLGWTYSPVFRMWTRRTDLSFVQVELDVRFNGWAGASQSWHGINLWLNRKLQSGSRVNDGAQEGYVIDFLNYDGRLYLMRHVGDAYDLLTDPVTWSPTPGQWYRWGGRVVKTTSGARIDVLRDGQVVQSATDSSPLLGGRVGLRSDYADFNANDLRITR